MMNLPDLVPGTRNGMVGSMHKLKNIVVHLFCLLLFTSGVQAAVVTPIDNPQLLSLAKTLPNQGVLKQLNNGYIYLEIAPSYSTQLPGLLNQQELTFDHPEIGAHVTVFTVRQVQKQQLYSIPELNNNYTFQITGINRVVTKHRGGSRIWYVLAIDAPELMALRAKYGFTRQFNLHISLAYQKGRSH